MVTAACPLFHSPAAGLLLHVTPLLSFHTFLLSVLKFAVVECLLVFQHRVSLHAHRAGLESQPTAAGYDIYTGRKVL